MSKKNTNTKKSKTSTTTTSLIGSSSSTHNGDHSDPELNIIFKKSYQNAKRHVVEMPWHQQYASDPSVNQKYKILTTSRILKGYDQSPSDTLFRTHTYEFRIVYPPTNVHLMKNNGGVSSNHEGSEYDDEDNDDDNDDEDDDYNGCYSRRNQTNNNRLATTPRSPISAAHIRLLKRVKSSSSSSSNSRNKNQNNNNNNNNNNNSNQSGAFIEYRLRGAPVISYTQINSPQDDYIVVMTWPDGLKANFKGKFKLELSLYSFDDDTNDNNDDKNSGGGGDFKKLVMTNRWTSDEFSVVSKPGVWMNHQKKKLAAASKNNKVMTTNNNNNSNVYSGDNIANLSITPSLLDIMTGGDEDEDEMMMKHFGSDTFPTMVVKSENTMNQQQQMDHANNHGSFMQQLGALHNNNNMNNNNNTLLLSNMNMMGASTGMGSTVNSNASSVIASINERVNNQHVNRESTSGMNMNNNHISSDSGGSGGSSSSSSGNSNNNQFFDDMEPNLLPSLSLPAAMSTPLGPGPDGDYFSSLMNMSQHLLDPNTPGQVLSPNGQFIISETMNNITGDGRFLSLSFSDFTGVTGRAMDSQEWEYASRNDDNTDRFFEKNLMNKK